MKPKNKAKTTNSNTKKKATTQWKYSKVKEMMRQELWDKSSDIHKWSAKKVASEFKNELKELGDYKFDRFNKNFEALKQKVYNEGLMVEKELEDFEEAVVWRCKNTLHVCVEYSIHLRRS